MVGECECSHSGCTVGVQREALLVGTDGFIIAPAGQKETRTRKRPSEDALTLQGEGLEINTPIKNMRQNPCLMATTSLLPVSGAQTSALHNLSLGLILLVEHGPHPPGGQMSYPLRFGHPLGIPHLSRPYCEHQLKQNYLPRAESIQSNAVLRS